MGYDFRGSFDAADRRMRRDDFSRRLMREHRLGATISFYPVFVLDGAKREEPSPSLPGIARKSVISFRDAERCMELGVPAIALFPVIRASRSRRCGEAWHSKVSFRVRWAR